MLARVSIISAYDPRRESMLAYACQCQNRWISGRGSRSVCLRLMVTGGKGHDVYLGSGPLDGGNTLLLLD